ncbi:TlpA family protein disulfide reductase [Paludibacterium purpuratum]|uniref:Thiol-disulfide isomerase/thioredoxin n=1 Tax=Paludibacterium purpuratum TaxID=1144873 RepID=A0A4R7B6T1_9NEIS|nr:TlpA disulfide reductase family protein [Paludibacterium purpuratum]TDR80368.1 thiol-disulfide isomerase/thioredoxin [Paludibacterium purpuratum]
MPHPQRLSPARLLACSLALLANFALAGPLDQAAFTDLAGRQVHLTDLRGKTVLVNFWGTWCGPCRKEMPMLNAMRQKWRGRNVEVVGIALDEKKPVQQFIQQQKINYPIWLGDENTTDLLPQLGNPAISVPFTLLIDKNGAILQRWVGEVSEASLKKALSSPAK